MESTTLVLRDPPGGSKLNYLFKRHRFTDHSLTQPGIILVLAHGVGFCKEIWEPFLEDLGSLQRLTGCPIVREAWVADTPNGGESAVINDKYLFYSPTDPIDVGLEDYARTILRLLISKHFVTIPGDRVVLLGHSMGAAALLWMSHFYHDEHHKLVDLCIAVESPNDLFKKPPVKENATVGYLDLAVSRKDIWSSREEAYAWFRERSPWKRWDRRALKAYVDHGICSLPTSGYPDRTDGVTLSYHRLHEVCAYLNVSEMNKVIRKMPLIFRLAPVHIVVGGRSLVGLSEELRKETARIPGVSVTCIPEAGHLVVQEMPQKLAKLIYELLVDYQCSKAQVERSRL